MSNPDQAQASKDTQKAGTKNKKQKQIEYGIIVGVLIALVSIYVFITDPSYEALIAILGGIATIITFIDKEKTAHKLGLVISLFLITVAGIIYVRLMTDPEEIIIVGIYYDGAQEREGDEYVIIRNEDLRTVQLEGWTLHDNQSVHVFTFPRYEMQPDEECRIYTNEDHSDWCSFNFGNGGSGVWNNTGKDMATLRNADGLVIDTSIDLIEPEETEEVDPTPEATITPQAGQASIVIININFDGVVNQNEPDEYVEIRNESEQVIQLKGWVLTDKDDINVFDFPDYALEPMVSCRIYTNEDHPEYCGFNFKKENQAIWANKGDCATLTNPEGEVVFTKCYP